MVIEERVKEHSDYQTALLECSDWLNLMTERVQSCSDVTGDIHSLQMRLDRLAVGVFLSLKFIMHCFTGRSHDS